MRLPVAIIISEGNALNERLNSTLSSFTSASLRENHDMLHEHFQFMSKITEVIPAMGALCTLPASCSHLVTVFSCERVKTSYPPRDAQRDYYKQAVFVSQLYRLPHLYCPLAGDTVEWHIVAATQMRWAMDWSHSVWWVYLVAHPVGSPYVYRSLRSFCYISMPFWRTLLWCLGWYTFFISRWHSFIINILRGVGCCGNIYG